jgi:hypothetical protein
MAGQLPSRELHVGLNELMVQVWKPSSLLGQSKDILGGGGGGGVGVGGGGRGWGWG